MVALVSVPAALALPVLVVLSGPEALVQAFALPGYAKAAGIAVISAGLGTVLALVLAVALLSGVAGRSDRWLRLSMPPLLATLSDDGEGWFKRTATVLGMVSDSK